jgi:redox-sensing transcriptional repressor
MTRRPVSANGAQGIPEATVARLPIYLRALYALADREIATVSSEELAAAAGVNSAKLRKDLSHLGSYGTRGVGYDVDYLVYQVSRVVQPADEIESVVARDAVSIGVIATPAAAAQKVCERLVAAGVTSILNFAPVVLDVPAGVDVRKVDLSIELQILAFHAQRRAVLQVARNGNWQDRQARRRGGLETGAPAAPGGLPSVPGDPGVEAQAIAR